MFPGRSLQLHGSGGPIFQAAYALNGFLALGEPGIVLAL
jgi:hypothetical protein